MPQTQRQPLAYAGRPTEIVDQPPGSDRVIHLGDQVKELQALSTISMGSTLRRLVFVWLRVYVKETKRDKSQKVNIKIPLPIPIIGATFARQLSFQKAARVAAQARRGQDVSDTLESAMGFEFVRVEEAHPDRDKSTLVVVGLD